MTVVIAETSRGAREVNITDLDDKALKALAASGQKEAQRAYWRRQLGTPRWQQRLSDRMGRE